MVTVRAMLGGVTLDRDVVVTVMTVDGTATGRYNVHVHVHVDSHLVCMYPNY